MMYTAKATEENSAKHEICYQVHVQNKTFLLCQWLTIASYFMINIS